MKIKFTPTYQEWRKIGNQYAVKKSKIIFIIIFIYSALAAAVLDDPQHWLGHFAIYFFSITLFFFLAYTIARLIRLKKTKKIFSKTDQTTEYDVTQEDIKIISKTSKFEGKTKDYVISAEVKDAIYIASKYNKRRPAAAIPKRAFKAPADITKFKSYFTPESQQ
jgi:hypothetical protein